MSLESLVITILVIAIVGFLVYLITTRIPMDESFKQLIIIVIVVFIVLWILGALTGYTSLPKLTK